MKPFLHYRILSLLAMLATSGVLAAEEDKKSASEVKSALDQSNSPEDLKVTQSIRKDVVGDGSLSLGAKNVKIITTDETVTLRGTVTSKEEHDKILSYAKKAAGAFKVVNQIEVKEAQP